jgi:diguanylate cyclase (GGDEF)-like protein
MSTPSQPSEQKGFVPAPNDVETLRGRIRALRRRLAAANREKEQLKACLGRDHLTGVPDRSRACSWLQEIVQQSESTACLLIDVDDFRSVNIELGHSGADVALADVARALERSLPDGARLARYGGDEFVVLVPAAAPEQARNIAEEFRTRFLEQPRPRGITVSIGLALWREGDSAVALIDRSDRALLRAKLGGKNRIELEH